MTTKLVTTVLFVIFATSSVFAECSKTELLQFIKLGFSKEEIKRICNDESITFEEDQEHNTEAKNDVVEKNATTEDENNRNLAEKNSVSTDVDKEEAEKSAFREFLDTATFGVFEDNEKEAVEKKEPQKTVVKSVETLKNHHLLLEFGGLNGYYTLSSNEEIIKEYSGKLNHGSNGSAFTVSYQYIHNGFVVGAGYHNYSLQGESDKSRQSFTSNGIFYDLEMKIFHKLNISGIFGMIGYEFTIYPKVELTPQLRYGFSNEVSAESILKIIDHDPTNIEDVSGEITVKDEIKSDVKIFALPVAYRFDSFSVGLNFYSMRNEFIDEEDTTTAKTETREGVLLSFGNKF
jgi:hypothetical protein